MDAIEQYLADRGIERLAESTVALYRDRLSKLGNHLGGEAAMLDDLTEVNLRQYFAGLNRDYKARTLAQHYSIVKNFCDWLLRFDYIAKNPILRITRPRNPKQHYNDFFTPAEVDLLLDACPESFAGLRLQAIMCTFYRSGLRLAELINLKVGQINFEARLIRVIGKGNKERVVPISDELRDVLASWLEIRERYLGWFKKDDQGYVFFSQNSMGKLDEKTLSNRVAKIGQRAGVKAHPHKFRHTFATELINHGCPLRVVQEILGHASLNTVLVYSHVTGQHIMTEYDRALAKRRIREGREMFPTKL